jgi:hypothetical protein
MCAPHPSFLVDCGDRGSIAPDANRASEGVWRDSQNSYNDIDCAAMLAGPHLCSYWSAAGWPAT